MSANTLNMNLSAWDISVDPYDHNQLAGNWTKIDVHDHTSGKGKQIPSAGLADGSVTTPKIADGAVTGNKIADGSVGYAKLGADAKAWKLGDLKLQWFPSGGSALIGSEWHVADGSTLSPGQHDWNGGAGTIILPNLVDHFPYGVDAGRVGNAAGSNSLDLAHNHTVNAHSHTVNAHSHVVDAHTHTVNPHAHGINPDGLHHHLWDNGVGFVNPSTRPYEISAGGTPRQALYIPGLNSGGSDFPAPMGDAGLHSHGNTTGAASASTTPSSPSTSAVSPGTSSASPGTSSALGNTDTRPAWVGLLPLIRIKN